VYVCNLLITEALWLGHIKIPVKLVKISVITFGEKSSCTNQKNAYRFSYYFEKRLEGFGGFGNELFFTFLSFGFSISL